MMFSGITGVQHYLISTAILIALIAVSGLLYIRLAPDDLLTWSSVPPQIAPDSSQTLPGGYLTRQHFDASSPRLLEELDVLIQQTPRTKMLTGSVAEGRLTYITRSRIFGFPDYTTLMVMPALGDSPEDSSDLTIYGRARYGRSDFGVNKRRIIGWLKALKASNVFPNP